MEGLKKKRTILRKTVTKSCNAFKSIMADQEATVKDKILSFQLLETKVIELEKVQEQLCDLMLDEKVDEAVIVKEIEDGDFYASTYLKAKMEVKEIEIQNRSMTQTGQVGPGTMVTVQPNEKTFFERIMKQFELPKFDGGVKGWLPFWSIYKKIHEDARASKEEKFHVLRKCMTENSRAYELVFSYPPVEDNYDKVINSLKNRFGKDDLVIEYYVRELLGLVLKNSVNGGQKLSLIQIYDKVDSYIRALETLGVTSEKCASMLFPLVESSLPEEILRAWQRSKHAVLEDAVENRAESRLTNLMEFLRQEVESQERIEIAMAGFDLSNEPDRMKKTSITRGKINKNDGPASASALVATGVSGKKFKCIFCNTVDHESRDCNQAKKLNLNQRKEKVKNEKGCFICLKKGHFAGNCKNYNISCYWCKKRHELLMCPELNKQEVTISTERDDQPLISCATLMNLPDVCLQVVRAYVFSEHKKLLVRIAFDSMSNRSYICSNIAKKLGYTSSGEIEIAHSLFGGIKSESKKFSMYKARVENKSGTFVCNFDVIAQDIICDNVAPLRKDKWMSELNKQKIVLSDVGKLYNNIDILIGGDICGKLYTGKKVELMCGLTAFETKLGWTVTGKLPDVDKKVDNFVEQNTLLVQEASPSQLWQLDVLGIRDPIEKVSESKRAEDARNFIRSTTTVDSDGRYEVKLPFTYDFSPLPSNYGIAKKRLDNTIIKLKKDNIFMEYDKILNNWLKDGIIELSGNETESKRVHYLPHRAVIKPGSTTAIRPVFDASAKENNCPSLNLCLEKGPNMIELLISNLIRFREHSIGVISDIKQAFLQIAICPEDRDFLRFLWVKNDALISFKHCRLVFGLSCSPFILASVLELVFDEAERQVKFEHKKYWTTDLIEKLRKAFYVDNCITSVDNKEELDYFVNESKKILSLGAFDLRGWEYSKDDLENSNTLVLGLSWNKLEDEISINPKMIEVNKSVRVTKRSILAAANKVYDPIGFTCPVAMQPKVILSELWNDKMGWDDEIDERRAKLFLEWENKLPLLSEIKLKRWIRNGRLTIHSFGDASGEAYACAVFARVETDSGVVVSLLGARSRIAPKGATISRLELMAATISVRLTNSIVNSFTRKIDDVFFWSDSTTVLAWISRDLQWGVFVYNRVKEIRENSKIEKWKFVPGKLNPADLPSRGCSAEQLVESEWWLGPMWLYKPENEWPTNPTEIKEEEIGAELKKSALKTLVTVQTENFNVYDIANTYSKLLRIFAWGRRFINNCRAKIDKRVNKDSKLVVSTGNVLSFKEIKDAESCILKHLQNVCFNVNDKNKLLSFKMIEEENGLKLLKTKIFNRQDDFMFLCPIILDKHQITEMIVREIHELNGHAGTQMTMCQVREKFWIISLRKMVKSIISKCIVCKKQTAKSLQCETPPLPLDRVRDAAIFEITGVDMAGPIYLKKGGKGWICIFTCAVYRAIHLELVSELSTDKFLEALRRFIARRGRPNKLYSDNGTNFRGASNFFNSLDWDQIRKKSATQQIDWQFIPPSAPWWGGWWERMIGIVKSILKKILGKANLSYESIATALCDVEAIVNSRPLTYVTENSDDLKPLSPSMFLQDIVEIGVPDCDMFSNNKLNKKYVFRQKICNDLRSRFRSEYLSQLLLTAKKSKSNLEIKKDDIVLVGDNNKKRIDWLLGRVVKLISGRDGIVRVCIVKTKNGDLTRPIQKLYPLEVNCNDNFCNLREKKNVILDVVRPEPDVNGSNFMTTRSGRIINKKVDL